MHSFVSFKGKVQTDLRFTIQWQIQRIEYGLNDTIRIKKREDKSIIDQFTPSYLVQFQKRAATNLKN